PKLMSSLYPRKDSPYIWLTYYDKLEPDPAKRRKSINTRIKNNRAGWKQARELQKSFDAGLIESQIFRSRGVKLKKRILLSEGLKEFLLEKDIKPNTVDAYKLAVRHFKDACKDKVIHNYTVNDGKKFIQYLSNQSQATQGIHTRHLSALFNYFVKSEYATKNIITIVPTVKGNPKSIPYSEVKNILKWYQKRNKTQFQFIYFLLLTGFRVSTALNLTWDKVDFENEIITATNVKANREFYFPIHEALKELLLKMNPQKSGKVIPYNQESPVFWRRNMPTLLEKNIIKKRYTLHQLRKTFGSWLANKGVDRSTLKELFDHSSISVTDDHYIEMQNTQKKKILNKNLRKVV
ncbi:MAG: tyrosine-type recombinase/integrase, partial [Ignavibacterium sp.]